MVEIAGEMEFANYGSVLCDGCVSVVIQYSPVRQEPTDGTFVQSGASSITQFLVMENQRVYLLLSHGQPPVTPAQSI